MSVISTIGASAKPLGIDWCDDNSCFEMKQHDSKGGKHNEQHKAKIRKDSICSRRAKRIAMESCHQYHVLIRQNHQDAEKESNGERGWESFQYKGSKNTKKEMRHSSEYRREHQGC